MKVPDLSAEELVELVERLRRAGFRIGVEQHLSAQRLLRALATREGSGVEFASLRRWLSPVLCSTPKEQAEFVRHFNEWAQERLHLSSASAEDDPDERRNPVDGSATGPARKLRLLLYASLLLLPLIIAPAAYWYKNRTAAPVQNTGAPEQPQATPTTSGTVTGGTAATPITALGVQNQNVAGPTNDLTGEMRPETESPPSASLAHKAYKRVRSNPLQLGLVCAALLFASAWGVWKFYAGLTLRRWRGDGEIVLDLVLEGASDLILRDQAFRRMAQEFHRHRPVEDADLDVTETIKATVSNGGWFSPVLGAHKSTPEYLALIDKASLKDQQARLCDELAARLHEHGIYIESYYFQRDPRVCHKEEPGALPVYFSLDELAGRHPRHHLMLLSDGAGLLDPRTGRPFRWLNLFSNWTVRGLLTHEFAGGAGYARRALSNAGFLVVPLSRDGMNLFLESIDTGLPPKDSAQGGTTATPAILSKRPERWLASQEPDAEDVAELCHQLREFLGRDGYEWLAACAFYPALEWELTLFWGRALRVGEGLEETLWKLVRLPWFRHGSMPDWLRTRLIDELPEERRKQIRRLLHRLLISALSEPETPISLQIIVGEDQPAEPEGFWRRFTGRWSRMVTRNLLSRFFDAMPEESTLSDRVFLSAMSGRSLDVDVPVELSRKLLRGSKPAIPPRLNGPAIVAGATTDKEPGGRLRQRWLKAFAPRGRRRRLAWLAVLLICAALAYASFTSWSVNDTGAYFGVVSPQPGQVLRYTTGINDPQSLDPQLGTGQPEELIYMALYEGLCEYHPQTGEPIPGIAERWSVDFSGAEFVFYLRKNARFSNGDPITARDFVYTFRRGLDPTLASRNVYLAYPIKYAQAYNEDSAFVRDPNTGRFILDTEVESGRSADISGGRYIPDNSAPDTEFHRYIVGPARLTVPTDEEKRNKLVESNPALGKVIAEKEFVPVKAEDVGVEAVDDYTLRITLTQPTPYFIGLLEKPFFRVVNQRSVEQYGAAAFNQSNSVTSGAFRLGAYEQGAQIVAEKNLLYWDASSTRLDKIYFLIGSDQTDVLDTYREGVSDVSQWVPIIYTPYFKTRADFMQTRSNFVVYLVVNVTKPPMNDLRVRKAFNLAIDKNALAASQGTYPLNAFVPEGVFPGYPQPKGNSYDLDAARRLLAEAGYRDASGNYDPTKFPVSEVELSYNNAESNRKVAEFVQAQWYQNLKLAVPLRSMEWRPFFSARGGLQYNGFAWAGWVGDYLDPSTYLLLFASSGGNNSTGWYDPKYTQMLATADSEPDGQKRYAMLALAESYLLDQQPVIPLILLPTNLLKKPYVKGLYATPTQVHPWKFVYIEHDSSKWGPADAADDAGPTTPAN